jgi:hypothetical protein
MKITSITPIRAEDLPKKVANTRSNQNVQEIANHLKTNPHLVVSGDDMKKFERYALQRKLQKAGCRVLVQSGTHPTTKKPSLFIRTLSDKEWKEYTAN